jgi:hypothetical protein
VEAQLEGITAEEVRLFSPVCVLVGRPHSRDTKSVMPAHSQKLREWRLARESAQASAYAGVSFDKSKRRYRVIFRIPGGGARVKLSSKGEEGDPDAEQIAAQTWDLCQLAFFGWYVKAAEKIFIEFLPVLCMYAPFPLILAGSEFTFINLYRSLGKFNFPTAQYVDCTSSTVPSVQAAVAKVAENKHLGEAVVTDAAAVASHIAAGVNIVGPYGTLIVGF